MILRFCSVTLTLSPSFPSTPVWRVKRVSILLLALSPPPPAPCRPPRQSWAFHPVSAVSAAWASASAATPQWRPQLAAPLQQHQVLAWVLLNRSVGAKRGSFCCLLHRGTFPFSSFFRKSPSQSPSWSATVVA